MCLGGHLAYRAALDPRVHATVCYFATDIHSKSLGEGKNDDSLARTKEINGELIMVFLRSIFEIRLLILLILCHRFLERKIHTSHLLVVILSERHSMRPVKLSVSTKWLMHSVSEFQLLSQYSERRHKLTGHKDAFIRDELSKGRYDPAIAGICFQMLLELYGRVLRSDLGPSEAAGELEHIC